MTAPYLGGMEIDSVERLSDLSIRVNFTSSYGGSYFYQLYVGRKLAGVTETALSRSVEGFAKDSDYPQHITLLAVTEANKATDYGSLLPDRPYNVVKLKFTPSGWTDAKWIDITSGTAPGGAVSSSNRIGRLLYDEDREYTFETEPLQHGTWNFEATGRDNKPADGNLGTALALQADVVAYPPDVTYTDTRLQVSVSGGTATVDFEA